MISLILHFSTFYIILYLYRLNRFLHLFLLVLLGLHLFSPSSLASAHTVLSFPQPRNKDSGIKGPYPCGTDTFWGPGQPITELKPGRVRVRPNFNSRAINNFGIFSKKWCIVFSLHSLFLPLWLDGSLSRAALIWQVTFNETINHIGAPFRIALSIGDDLGFDEHILLDQVRPSLLIAVLS